MKGERKILEGGLDNSGNIEGSLKDYWSRVITAASLEPYFIYNAIVHAPLVAPTPLLIIHGTKDLALLPEFAQQAYDAAVGPQELVWMETHNHIELYDQDPYVSQACEVIVRWLGEHLKV